MARDEEKLAEEARRRVNDQDTHDTVKGEEVDKSSSQVEEATMEGNDKSLDLEKILKNPNIPSEDKIAAVDKAIQGVDDSFSEGERLYSRNIAKQQAGSDAFRKTYLPWCAAGIVAAIVFGAPPIGIGLILGGTIVAIKKAISAHRNSNGGLMTLAERATLKEFKRDKSKVKAHERKLGKKSKLILRKRELQLAKVMNDPSSSIMDKIRASIKENKAKLAAYGLKGLLKGKANKKGTTVVATDPLTDTELSASKRSQVQMTPGAKAAKVAQEASKAQALGTEQAPARRQSSRGPSIG